MDVPRLRRLYVGLGLVFLICGSACGDDTSPDAGGDSSVDASTPGPDAGRSADAGLDDAGDSGTCEDCATCEEDPGQARCVSCETQPWLPDCPFEEPTFDGLSAEVEILRDATGIPHVYASTDADAMYGSGYAQATDRLFHMDLTRRRARGRRAEVLGDGYVADDAFIRRVNILGWARMTAGAARTTAPDVFALAAAWTAGVNTRIAEIERGEAPLPLGFGSEGLGHMPERFSVLDAFAVGKLLLFGNGNQLEYDILTSLLRKYLPTLYAKIPIVTPLEDAFILESDELPSPTGARGSFGDREPPRIPRSAEPDDEPDDIPGNGSDNGSDNGSGEDSADRPGVRLPADAEARLMELVERLAPYRSGGSNNWAIRGELTENGRPIIANDPHQPLRSPSIFWVHHVNSADAGGSLDAVGFSFVGTPLVQLGHNRRVSWAATTNFADTMDVWSVSVRDGRASVGGRELSVVSYQEQIEVRDGETVTETIEWIPGYGVLLPKGFVPLPLADNDRRVLFNWTGFGPTNEFRVFYEFNVAESRDAIEEAADGFEIGSFNWLAADENGIVYRSGMSVPDRGTGGSSALPYAILDGDDPTTYWTGEILPSELLPYSDGTGRGFISTANNDPFGFTSDGDVQNDLFYFGAFFDPGTRARRIDDELTRLAERGGITLREMQTLQHDCHSILADRMIPLLSTAWDQAASDPSLSELRGRSDLARLVALLTEEWDRRMDRDSSGAVAFEVFLAFSVRGTIGDDLAVFFDPVLSAAPIYATKFAMLTLLERYPAAGELMQGGRAHILLEALSETAAFLTRRFGGSDPDVVGYRWGDFHRTRFPAELSAYGAPNLPTDGSMGTVNVSEASFFRGGEPVMNLASTSGAIFRSVTTFNAGGVPESWVNFPRGVSEDPASPFWENTVEDWANGVYRPLLFERADVEAELTGSTTLAP